jgi:hypothetical protein
MHSSLQELVLAIFAVTPTSMNLIGICVIWRAYARLYFHTERWQTLKTQLRIMMEVEQYEKVSNTFSPPPRLEAKRKWKLLRSCGYFSGYHPQRLEMRFKIQGRKRKSINKMNSFCKAFNGTRIFSIKKEFIWHCLWSSLRRVTNSQSYKWFFIVLTITWRMIMLNKCFYR